MCGTWIGPPSLTWHCLYDSKATPEQERAPASQASISAFIVHTAAAYSGKTISNYLHGAQAWHIMHSVPWHLKKAKMGTELLKEKEAMAM